ncbi:hypothetical protein Fmac_032260 [Flemingia macrophylla]|uniref:Uncharacterized protein n=1 Tax=Flemingia macrophylla TaxID=520843 RepID=A0ABD1L4D9_9FABA
MEAEDRARIEKFLEDYKRMKPTRFTYADIKRITNGFSESLGEGAHGAVFKGMLSREILVAMKILKDTMGDGKDFINEPIMPTLWSPSHLSSSRVGPSSRCKDGPNKESKRTASS